MFRENFIQTAESVSEGHPDKIADQISDAILDAFVSIDPLAKSAIEVLVKGHQIHIAGEFDIDEKFTEDNIHKFLDDIVYSVLVDIGYDNKKFGYLIENIYLSHSIFNQSDEIKKAVVKPNKKIGAGDQGLMYGYACNETSELMPLPITMAHDILKELSDERKSGNIKWLGPDAKSQVSIVYKDRKPYSVDCIVLSTQHRRKVKNMEIKNTLKDFIERKMKNPFSKYEGLISEDAKIFINPSGSFVMGGPLADTGLTGRKIISDTYGPGIPHGGGAFSGKDATKVDRSGAYMARYIAKNIVASGLATHCLVQLAYVIGYEEPVTFQLDFLGTGKCEEKIVEEGIRDIFNLTPAGIIEQLELLRPYYRLTSVYGHFGRSDFEDIFRNNPSLNGVALFPWEETDKEEKIESYFQNIYNYLIWK